MKIQVMSRSMVEDYPTYFQQLGKHAIISISSPHHRDAELPQHPECEGILRLKFHDIAPWDKVSIQDLKSKKNIDPVFFSSEDAQAIYDFVSSHKDTETLIVHCEMGISRSAAVAAAISKVIHGDDERFFRQYRPNPFVYTNVLKYFNGQNDQSEEHINS